jgi:hypothetical protein
MADEMDSDPLLRKYRAMQVAKQSGLLLACIDPVISVRLDTLVAHAVSCLCVGQTEAQLD